MYDLVIRGGWVVQSTGVERADLAVEAGRIARIAPEIAEPGREVVEAEGLYLFPGVIDVHVHFNEPGRTEWEGIGHGSRALVAGGGVLFADMPLNALPPVLDRASLELKRRAAETASVADFALWGGLTPGNLQALPELAEGGVIGFKAFMADSGVAEFPAADDHTLYEGMQIAKTLGLPVAVHAENRGLVAGLAEQLRRAGRVAAADYLSSRPALAEVEAVQRALLFAEDTGCRLHIVHASTGRSVALAWEARQRGVDVSVETCPHYLLFTDEDLERLGAALKCAPPVRTSAEQEALWRACREGRIDLVASDHSPAPLDLKQGNDFFAIWGGIAGVQFTLPALLTEGHSRRGLALEVIAALLAERPADRFRFEGRGRLAEGYSADIAVVDLGTVWSPGEADLLQRHKISPYLGCTFRGRVRRTIVRGQTVYLEGRVASEAGGRFVYPGSLGGAM